MISRVRIRTFHPNDTEDVVALWETAELTRPWNDPRKDIARKREIQPELFVVAVDDDDRIIGAVMAGYDGHRGWMNYLAADPDFRGAGVGRALVDHVEEALHALGCPKVSIQVRSSNAQVVAFYEHLGYTVDDTIDLGKRLIADPAPGTVER
jgi:ribosomal protein S18 acetylase RimI-like enzyme